METFNLEEKACQQVARLPLEAKETKPWLRWRSASNKNYYVTWNL